MKLFSYGNINFCHCPKSTLKHSFIQFSSQKTATRRVLNVMNMSNSKESLHNPSIHNSKLRWENNTKFKRDIPWIRLSEPSLTREKSFKLIVNINLQRKSTKPRVQTPFILKKITGNVNKPTLHQELTVNFNKPKTRDPFLKCIRKYIE